MGMQVVWFKRDLRVHDHAALAGAAAAGPVCCLWVDEPSRWQAPEWDAAHWHFINDCLCCLDRDLRQRGTKLLRLVGDLPTVLERLHRRHPIDALWSHQETGTLATYARDRAVRQWCREHRIPWHEPPQHGVIRRLQDRDGWSRHWQQFMRQPVAPTPSRIVGMNRLRSDPTLIASDVPLPQRPCGPQPAGGTTAARDTLQSFLHQRGQAYRSAMSSPVTAYDACSRLSPYLAWGAISLREVFQATAARQANVKARAKDGDPSVRGWGGSLSSFQSRLRWHCHFMQKLEDQPDLEHVNLHRACDGLREDDWDQERFERWATGQTGFPMVDACMRALLAQRWINFRMRAMLVSFASYDLWLHWRQPALHLARCFLDYEPGIHFSQVQMQSGTTGINTLRMYSPTKQVHDQDPEGVFIRTWVPELADVPTACIAEPWRMSRDQQQQAGCWIGETYPAPVVDHAEAVRTARARFAALRRSTTAREEAKRIVAKHGSRRRPPRHRRRPPRTSDDAGPTRLDINGQRDGAA